MRRTLIMAALLIATLTPVRADEDVDLLIAYILDAMEARQAPCREAQLEGHDRKRVVCGVYAQGFSAFKSDWDMVMLHTKIPIEIETEDTWTFRRGSYEITYEYEGDRELWVAFAPDGGGLVFAYEEREVEDYTRRASAKTGPLDLPGGDPPPRMAGFGGVSVPKLIEDSHVEPVRSFRAQAERVVGQATLEIVVNADGTVRDALALKEDPKGYDIGKCAVEAALQWRFEPAMFEGEAVPVVMNKTVDVRKDPPPPGDD